MIFTETCKECNWQKIDEFDSTIEEPPPINEEERKKYCTAFINRRTFWEDLEAIADFLQHAEKIDKEKSEKQKYDFDHIQRINIPQLEQRITSLAEKGGYIKPLFEKPVFKSHTVIEFSLQDPTDRNEKDSIKKLQKQLTEDLFETNWRLMKSSISYRMGCLTGKLKGFDNDEDLMKIAKEIYEKRKKPDSKKEHY